MQIEFLVGEKTASGYLALPAQGMGPGVLVLHAWWGLNDVFKDACDRLAEQGFVALAPDLYSGKTAATIEQARELQATVDGDSNYAVISGAANYLRNHPAVQGDRLGVVGFSMGGAWALLLEEHIAAVVTFYGTTEAEYVSAVAAFQGHFAEHDDYEPEEAVRQLEEAIRASGREVTFYFYPGTEHWFCESDRPQYNEQAAALAWQRTFEFLHAHL